MRCEPWIQKKASIAICNVQLAEHFVCSSRMFTTRKRRINRNDHEINKNDMHLKLAISSPPTLNIISNSNAFGNFPCLPKWRWKIRGPATSNSFSFFQAWEFKIAKFNFTFIFKLVFTHNQLWWMHQHLTAFDQFSVLNHKSTSWIHKFKPRFTCLMP